MNLTRLRYFVVVAEELHFGRAAARLHMAQPPLSRHIRTLESEVGADLFTRTTRRVELTPAGRLLYPEATRLLAHADGIDRLMGQFRSGEAGILRIGFVDSASYAVMPRFLQAYRERWPDVDFELHAMSSEAQHDALAQGGIDIGLARSESHDSGLEQTVILEERLFVAVSTRHRLAGRASTSLGQLAGESFISFSRTASPALTGELRAILASAGTDYDPVIEAEEYTTILGLVAAGEGIAVVPATVRAFAPDGLRYVALRDDVARTRLMMLSRRDEPLRVVQRARDLAADLFGDRQAPA